MEDKGSHSMCVRVQVEGVPVYGLIDTGADITIIGGNLFKKVAAVARLKKKNFQPADKIAHNYDGKPFQLHGRMMMEITFQEKTLRTPVYIKMDAQDQLLLSEGACRQLNIVTYHPEAQVWRGGQARRRQGSAEQRDQAKVPAVHVRLLTTLRIPPHHSTVVGVRAGQGQKQLLLEPTQSNPKLHALLEGAALVETRPDGVANIILTNKLGHTVRVQQGASIATASVAEVVDPATNLEGDPWPDTPAVPVRAVSAEASRVEKLFALLPKEEVSLTEDQQQKLNSCLVHHHQAFSLEEGERGETDQIQMHIDTGDSPPKKQHLRRMPFAVRQEVAHQLQRMQEMGVIRPSTSPWSSPIVLVRKKDGTLRFCVDYRHLNSVTKADTYPLPRIDDLLDQLGKSRHFSTLDLASGYWQIPVDPASCEKTAFTTHRGLFEFQVMPFGLKNAPAVFQRLMEQVLRRLNPEDGPDFVSVYIDDVLVFSPSFEEHVDHVSQVLNALHNANLKLKPTKCHFFRQEVEYLGHLLTTEGLKPNPSNTSAVINFPPPSCLQQLRQFLGLASYYRRFIPGFAKIAYPLHFLTKKGVKFAWSEECQEAFQTLKEKLTSPPVLCYPDFARDFVLETDASTKGLGAVINQIQGDGRPHPVAYASRALTPAESNYAITELETLAVVWACSHFHAYLYGHNVVIYTDHSAVKAILGAPSLNGKHARWWTKVYGSGIRDIQIQHRTGRENTNADALSRSPQMPAPPEGTVEAEVQVATVSTSAELNDMDVEQLLELPPATSVPDDFGAEQLKDPHLAELISYLAKEDLPQDPHRAHKIAAKASMFAMVDNILYFIDPKRRNRKRAVVPQHLRQTIMEENHSGPMAGHFSGNRVYSALARSWWWPGMYSDVEHHCRICPQCAFVSGAKHSQKPLLQPIPVQRAFQIVGIDIMDLPKTDKGNQHVVVLQDFLTKWPLVYPVPDQKTHRVVKLFTEELVPMFGVPEALLSDRGTNLLSNLMLDICEILGTKKLNTTSYHPQCDGMVERLNRTLKSMLRKHAATFGPQWDRYLPGVLWAYRNTPHESTGEKPSFLLFGFDCRTPSEAAWLPSVISPGTDISDYRQELMLSLTSARELAASCIQKAQSRYKAQYDKNLSPAEYHIGDWVLVHFPQEETGRMRKLSRPWHGPYRILSQNGPDVTIVKVYHPQHGTIQVHQSRIKPCPLDFPAGSYWYGTRRPGPGRPPRWTEELVDQLPTQADNPQNNSTDLPPEDPVCSEPTLTEDCAESNSGSPTTTSRSHHTYSLRPRVSPPKRL